jgi:GNAT superfamily N-acetyltransferase
MNLVRAASILDIPLLARHRAAMFRDMGTLASGSEAALVRATETYLREAMPRNEYLAWVLNVYVEPPWRRRVVAEGLLQTVLTALAERRIRRIGLHASVDGRRLYERLGFAPTNEMQLITGPIR